MIFKIMKCTICGLDYIKREPLMRHYHKIHSKTHHSKKKSNKKHPTCAICGLVYSQRDSLLRHIKAKHIEKKETESNNLQVELSE